MAAALLLVRRREAAVVRALLAGERETLSLTRDAVRVAVDRVVSEIADDARHYDDASLARRARSRIRVATPTLTIALTHALTEGRQRARDRATADLERDDAQAIANDDGSDDAYAHAAAASLAAAWASFSVRATAAVPARRRGGLPSSLRSTIAYLDGRVRRTAATETALAFNDERSRAAEALIARDDAIARDRGRPPPPAGAPYRDGRRNEPPPRLVKTWSALLDAKVCPSCAEMHGTTIPLGDEFPGGDPPKHPFCRCIFVVHAIVIPIDVFQRAQQREAA